MQVPQLRFGNVDAWAGVLWLIPTDNTELAYPPLHPASALPEQNLKRGDVCIQRSSEHFLWQLVACETRYKDYKR